MFTFVICFLLTLVNRPLTVMEPGELPIVLTVNQAAPLNAGTGVPQALIQVTTVPLAPAAAQPVPRFPPTPSPLSLPSPTTQEATLSVQHVVQVVCQVFSSTTPKPSQLCPPHLHFLPRLYPFPWLSRLAATTPHPPPRGSTKPSYISYNTGHLPSHAFYIKPHANLLPHQIQQNSHSHTHSCNVATFIPSVTVISHNHTVMHWWFVALFLQSLYVSHDVLTKHLSSAKKDYRKIQAGTKLIRVYSGTNLSCTLEDCKLLGHWLPFCVMLICNVYVSREKYLAPTKWGKPKAVLNSALNHQHQQLHSLLGFIAHVGGGHIAATTHSRQQNRRKFLWDIRQYNKDEASCRQPSFG